MKIVFDQKAIDDLQSIHDWISASSSRAAEKVVEQLVSGIQNLDEFPERGRIGQSPHERELIVPGLPYVVVYEVRQEAGDVLVLAIFHGAQDRTRSG